MTGHDRKRNVRIHAKSPIATPPRVAVQGRSSRNDPQVNTPSDGTPSPNAQTTTPEAETNPTSGPPPPPRAKSQSNHSKDGTAGEDPASRIASLEIEMAKMEDEFSLELMNLGEKLAASTETATYWQNKHSSVHQQFLAVDTDLRVLQHENAVRAREREERDKDVKTRISSLILDRDTLREGYQAAKSSLFNCEREMERLKGQIKGLKDFVSTSSRVDGQVSDEVLGEMMRGLGNGLQNWVIVNFRKSKMDISPIPKEIKEDLEALVPTYEQLALSSKVHLIQSIVSRILVREIFNSYYVGLPEERAFELRNLEDYLEKATGDSASSNQLRSTTLSIVQKSAPLDVETARESIINNIVDHLDRLAIHTMDLKLSDNAKSSFRVLISSAVDLARLLRVQKAIFEPMMPLVEPHHIHTFDADTMEDIGGEDEDGLQGREIRCVAFPGIVKRGDISGENTSELRNVIAKARVLCLSD